MIHFWDYVTITPYNLIHGPEAWLGIAGIYGIVFILIVFWVVIMFIRRK